MNHDRPPSPSVRTVTVSTLLTYELDHDGNIVRATVPTIDDLDAWILCVELEAPDEGYEVGFTADQRPTAITRTTDGTTVYDLTLDRGWPASMAGLRARVPDARPPLDWQAPAGQDTTTTKETP